MNVFVAAVVMATAAALVVEVLLVVWHCVVVVFYLSIHLFICLPTCLSVYPSLCLSVYLSSLKLENAAVLGDALKV